jgi:hypothetical protein
LRPSILGCAIRLHLLEQFNQFAGPERELMQGVQIGLDAPDRHPQRGPQKGDQGGDPHTDAPLPKQLFGQVQGRTAPALAVGADAFDELLEHQLKRRWWQ